MKVKVNIFYPALQQTVNKQGLLEVEGNTVGECLDNLIERFPAAEQWLFNERGQLLEHVYVYINAESAHRTDPSDPLKDGDELIIAAVVMGG